MKIPYRIALWGVIVILGLASTAYIGNLVIVKAFTLQKGFEDRLKIVMTTINRKVSSQVSEIKFGPSEPAASTNEPAASTKNDSTRTIVFRKSDPIARIYAELGDPMAKENVGEVQILKYTGCNVACKDGVVIGWVIK